MRGDDTKPQEAKIITIEKKELTEKVAMDIHELKKLRSGMNLISSRLSDPSLRSDPKDYSRIKAAFDKVKKEVNEMKDLDRTNEDIKRLVDNLKTMIEQGDFVFDPPKETSRSFQSKKAKHMKSMQVRCGQLQNCRVERSGGKGPNSGNRQTRSKLQMKVRQTDWSNYSDDEDIGEEEITQGKGSMKKGAKGGKSFK